MWGHPLDFIYLGLSLKGTKYFDSQWSFSQLCSLQRWSDHMLYLLFWHISSSDITIHHDNALITLTRLHCVTAVVPVAVWSKGGDSRVETLWRVSSAAEKVFNERIWGALWHDEWKAIWINAQTSPVYTWHTAWASGTPTYGREVGTECSVRSLPTHAFILFSVLACSWCSEWKESLLSPWFSLIPPHKTCSTSLLSCFEY